ncbi:MAG TPA: hypothetical protein VH395_06620 [Jatrophihabitantaceae bacterium]|jgi:hypothetical protein
MRASSASLFGIELGSYEQYLPDEQTLAQTLRRPARDFTAVSR